MLPRLNSRKSKPPYPKKYDVVQRRSYASVKICRAKKKYITNCTIVFRNDYYVTFMPDTFTTDTEAK